MARHGRGFGRGAARAKLGFLLGLLVWFPVAPVAAAIDYLYDDAGRLIAVIDPAQGSAIYTYDAVGSLLAITRQATGIVSVLNFTPRAGPAGTVVRIQGTGFSATPSQNAVTFNGTAASVTAATPTELVATVPAGATTGGIAVTAPAGAGASSAPFTVTATSGAPTITGFTPSIGTPGTAVTVSGSDFEVPYLTNKVAFNVSPGHPTSGSATTIGTSVPSPVGSGRLTVATPLGTAVSAADFFVPPAPYTAADVDFTGRVTVGGSIAVSIPTANRIGLVVFDGTAGQRMGLETRASNLQSADLKLYSPTGTLLHTRNVGTLDQLTDVGTLPATGTYTVMIDPTGTYTGGLTVTPGLPDLQVTAGTAPAAVNRSNTGTYQFAVSWTVQNAGTASAYFQSVNWHDRVYLSTNASDDASDVQVLSQARTAPLAAGASYTVSSTATSPAMAPGTYYVLFVADHVGGIPETTETNNVYAVGPITLLGPPDLVPTAFTGPASVPRSNTGTYSLPVSWTVTNEGGSATAVGVSDYVYLSTDATWDASDTYLGAVFTAPPLAAGASYTKNQTYLTATLPPGPYYLIVRVDAQGGLVESNETNNTRVLPIELLAGPDLVPTAFTGPGSVPRSPTGTYSIPVSWTITNEGPSATVGGAYDYVYLSTDTTVDGADTLLTSVYTPTSLAAGASYTKNQTLNSSAAPGSYYLILRADGAASIAESNETNNTRVLGPLALLNHPDLTPTALTGPTSPVPRNANGTYTFALSWTVTNQGQSPTGSNWTDRVFVSPTPTYSGNQVATATRSTVLASGASYIETRPSVTTPVTSPGTYYLVVRTDADSGVPEADDTNNTLVYGPFTLSP